MAFKVTLQPSGHCYDADADTTLLDAALEANIQIPYGCRNGACGTCKSRLISGDVERGDAKAQGLSDEERSAGMLLACCAKPASDLVIECREASARDDVQPRLLPVRVHRLSKVAPDVMLVQLKLPASERLQFSAGQYVEFVLKDGKRRAFSIANAPHDDEFLELHIRRMPEGNFTKYVFDGMKEREILRIEAPFGSFGLQESSDKPIILIAGGTGFAPIKAIVEHALHAGIRRPMTLYWGSRDRSGLYLPELPITWSAQIDNFRYVPVLSEPSAADAWCGRTGLVHQAVLDDFGDLSGHQVYICGAPAMIQAASRDFLAHRLPAEEFFADAFTPAAQ